MFGHTENEKNMLGDLPVSKKKLIRWEELQKHNNSQDCWLAVRGKVYNVTRWVPNHPGGNDPLVLNAGRDGTQLFEAYHPIRVHAMLDKYFIGDLEDNPKNPTFPEMSEFYKTLKAKIEDYFQQKKMSPRYAPEMLVRSFFLISAVFLFHYLSVVTNSFFLSLLCSTICGTCTALVCFMPVHEGSHASTTNSPFLWRLLGASNDFVNGASYYSWCHQHFLGHHPYTNVTEEDTYALDPDVVTGDPDMRRIKPHQKWHQHYKFQAIYVPLLYGFLGLKFRINDFLILFVIHKNGAIRLNPPDTWHLTMFWAGKIFFLFYRILVPAYYLGSLLNAILLFVFSDMMSSYVLAFFFQVNHIVPHAKWPITDRDTGKVNMDWAEMQIRTTLDYAHGAYWTTLFTGALNYQVTHHLFPYVSQIHYPDIAPIVLEHCKKYGIEYNVLPTFTDALKAHLKYLSVMSHSHAGF